MWIKKEYYPAEHRRTSRIKIDSNWWISSFFALTSNKTHAAELPDHDSFLQNNHFFF